MRKYLFVISYTLLFVFGCKEDDHPVPNQRFTAYINLMLPDYINKDAFVAIYDSYGSRIGIGGVIVYRVGDGRYYVFERYCPHDEKLTCLVDLEEGNTSAQCPCCESRFFIISETGDRIEGPSDYSLKPYRNRVEPNGTILVIYN